jgi:hypothetical protein
MVSSVRWIDPGGRRIIAMTISEIIKKKWQDPEYRARQAASKSRQKEAVSQAMKEQWADPEKRAARVAVLSSPETRQRMSESHSEALKEQWKDPEYRARMSAQNSESAKKRQGSSHPRFKHGLAHGPEYRAYHTAKQRCTNPKNKGYCNYGMRGIEFRFASFEEFIEHLGRRPSAKHSLERLNNNGHYEIGNVAWSTAREQVLNRRSANSHCRHCGELLVCPCQEPEYGLEAC